MQQQNDYNRHLLTAKHKILQNTTKYYKILQIKPPPNTTNKTPQ
jgi:hypothetical protein